jgi:hypothetical protein
VTTRGLESLVVGRIEAILLASLELQIANEM